MGKEEEDEDDDRRRAMGDPQLLIEKIVRLRIRESRYWKEHCFGLTADLLVDKAVELTCLGGVSSETNRPTPFLCLLLRMLAIAPSMDIVLELIRNEDYKYVRCLGAMYLRLVGLAEDVYKELEPLLQDYRKICIHQRQSWELSTVDTFIETLLTQSTCFEIALPYLSKRHHVPSLKDGPPRESSLREEFQLLFPENSSSSSSDVPSKRVKTLH